MRRLAAIAVALSLAVPAAARAAEPIKADLSNHVVSITTGFTGTSLVLFGTREEAGDIVIVVRGPASQAVVRRSHHVLGFWIKTESATFADVPSFYAVISDRPLDEAAPEPVLRQYQIGIARLYPRLEAPRHLRPPREAAFRTALVRRQERNDRFVTDIGSITFIGDHLFRTRLTFPSNVPVGTYSVEVFLFRNGELVARETVPLSVVEAGVDANVAQFAQSEGLYYGLIAVAATAMAGWLATLPFRTR